MGFWLNQALGLLGSLIVFVSVQFNNRRVILAAQAAACLMWIVHYGLLGAMTAATINILSFARSVVFYFNDRKWAQSRAWLWAFLALYRPHVGRAGESAARHRHEHDDGRALDARHAPHAPALPDQFAVLVHV